MKKKAILPVLIAIIFIIPLSAVAATGNRQMVYPVDSPLYDAIKYLYIAEGLALPSTTGPWTAAELDIMFDRIDADGLNESEEKTYSWIESELGKEARFKPSDGFGFDIDADMSIVGRYQTNPKDFSSLDDFSIRRRWTKQTPLFSFPFDAWFGDHVYGHSSLDIGINRTLCSGIKGSPFFTNIYMVPPCRMDDLDFNVPYRAVGSIGGRYWNFSIGRDRISWGPGESGNFVMGDQVPYQNNARFTAFADHLKYTMSISSFIHPMNYMKADSFEVPDLDDEGKQKYEYFYDPEDPDKVVGRRPLYKTVAGPDYFDPDNSQSTMRHGTSIFVSHRLEWRIVDKIGMSLTESTMYQSKENRFDLLVLSPTAIFHDYHIRGNANSTLSFEMDYAPIKHLDIYGALIIDELALPGEAGPEKSGPPSAAGYLAGVKTSFSLGDGLLYGSLEGVYTDPWLYIRDGGDCNPDRYGINFIVATSEIGKDPAGNYTLDFLGYGYGNDSIVANFNLGYKVYGYWFIDGTYTFWADGTMDGFSKWIEAYPGSENDPPAPSAEHPSSGSFEKGADTAGRDAVAYWSLVSLKGGVTLFRGLDIWSEVNYWYCANYMNESGLKTDDVQLSLGISWSFR